MYILDLIEEKKHQIFKTIHGMVELKSQINSNIRQKKIPYPYILKKIKLTIPLCKIYFRNTIISSNIIHNFCWQYLLTEITNKNFITHIYTLKTITPYKY